MMKTALSALDLWIIFGFLGSVVLLGAWAAKRASKSAEDFFGEYQGSMVAKLAD